MMKHIQNHTHAFLFFLGGLFLMLVGPSLIPFSNAATVAATANVATTNINSKIAANQTLLNAAANKKLSKTELTATTNIVATILNDISNLTDTVEANRQIIDLQTNLAKLIDNIEADDDVMKVAKNAFLNLNNILTLTSQTKTKAALQNGLKKALKIVNELEKELEKELENNTNKRGSKVRILRKESYNQTQVTITHAAAATSTTNSNNAVVALALTPLNKALENANVPAILPATANVTDTLTYFTNFFNVAFQNLRNNLNTVAKYFAERDEKLQQQNQILQKKLDTLLDFIQEANLGTQAQRDALNIEFNNLDEQYQQEKPIQTSENKNKTNNEPHNAASITYIKR